MHDDAQCPYVGEYAQLARANAALRAALEPLISFAVRHHEFSPVLTGHCATCTSITRARVALNGEPATAPTAQTRGPA